MTLSLGLHRNLRRAGCAAVCFAFHLGASDQSERPDDWQNKLLVDLCAKYQVDPPRDRAAASVLDLLAAKIGQLLVAAGSDGLPAEDVAKLALLLARRNGPEHKGKPRTLDVPNPGTLAEPRNQGRPEAAATVRAVEDIQKGQEGFRQGIERLRQLPPSERFVLTGDITSGVQAATVPMTSDLTSVFGRARVNVVARAVPGSPDGLFSEGHFFLQLQDGVPPIVES